MTRPDTSGERWGQWAHRVRYSLVGSAWARLNLPLQCLLVGVLTTLMILALVWAGTQDSTHGGQLWAALAVMGGLVTAACAVLMWRVELRLRMLADAAQALRHGGEQLGRNFPRDTSSLGLRRTSTQLRHLVCTLHQRLRVLTAANATLANQLTTRTHELTTLATLSIGLSQRTDVYGLIDEALGALEQTMAYSSASVWGRPPATTQGPVVLMGYRSPSHAQEGEPAGALTGMRLSRQHLERFEQIERERQPVIENRARQSLLSWLWTKLTDDARTSALYRSTRAWMAVPLTSREQVLGVLRVDHHEPDFFDVERARLLQAVGSQTALAIRHAQMLEREREVAVMAERNRIARELHDAVSQTLFAANVVAGTLARGAERPQDEASMAALAEQARTLEQLNRGALSEMRLLMYELRPDAMEQTPLTDLLGHAIDALRSRTEIDVAHDLQRDEVVSPGVRMQFYRIAQEAFSNIARHAGARQVSVRWRTSADGAAQLRIADDGLGFDPSKSHPGHFGLENMRSRAAEVGARLEIDSVPGQGTVLTVERGEWPDDE